MANGSVQNRQQARLEVLFQIVSILEVETDQLLTKIKKEDEK